MEFENKIETLHDECSHLLGFGRIYFKNDNIKISKSTIKVGVMDE